MLANKVYDVNSYCIICICKRNQSLSLQCTNYLAGIFLLLCISFLCLYFFPPLTTTEDAHRINGTAKVGEVEHAEVGFSQISWLSFVF